MPTSPRPDKPAGKLAPRLIRRLLIWLVAGTALIGGVAWLAGTNSGLQFLLQLATSASGDRLQIENADGRLLGPISIGTLRWNTPDIQISVDDIQTDWIPGDLLHGQLHLTELRVGSLHITSAASSSPTPLPADLTLPLDINIEKISLSRLEYGNTFVASELAGHVDYLAGQYRLDDFRARLGSVNITGQAGLGALAPLALTASAEIAGQLEDQPLALHLSAAGPLEKLRLEATASRGLQGTAKATLTPFAKASFSEAQVNLDDFDPARWQGGAPTARLQLRADLKPAGDGVAGNFSISNRNPGPLDRQRLPLLDLSGRLDWQGETARLDGLKARLPGAGEMAGAGHWQNGALQLDLRASRLDAAQIVSALRPTRLGGMLSASLAANRQSLEVDLQENDFRLQASASQSTGKITLPRLELSAGPARLSAKGELALDKNMAFSATGELQNFDPSRFAKVGTARINASLTAEGKLAPKALIDGQFSLSDSQWGGQPLGGQGRLKIDWPHIPQADIQLQAGANHLTSHGAFGRPGDSLSIDIEAPQIAPFGFDGGIGGHLDLAGSIEQPKLNGRLQATRLGRPGQWRLDGLALTAEGGGEASSPLRLELAIANLETPDQPGLLKQLQLRGEGSNQKHHLTASARVAGANQLTLAADGGLLRDKDGPGWHGQLQQASMQAADKARNFTLKAPAALDISGNGWHLGPAQLAGQELDWQATLQGSATTQKLQASLSARGSRLGRIEAQLDAGLQDAWSLDRAATWQGKLTMDIADLGWLAELIGEQWQSEGRFNGELRLGGSPAKPVASGHWRGEKLALRLPEQGLNLADGELDVELANNRLRVSKLGFNSLLQALPRPLRLNLKEDAARFSEQPGRLEISGEMPIGQGLDIEQAFLDFHLERLGAWQLPDQWVAVSGDGRLTWKDNTLGARGKLAVDAGYWQLAKSGTPQLSDDVFIKRPAGEKPAANMRPKLDIDITSELGRNFLFSGAGLSARLAGNIRLRASGRDLPRASGSIRAVDGRFDAYGQQLSIERGILAFQGLLDNPTLDVRAVRLGLAIGPGIQISGTAKKPIIKLVSDPELPDPEKLAWLVLGHGPEQMGAGDASLLLSAAGGLLGNDSGGLVQQLKTRFGFDELGVRTGQIGDLGGRQPASRIAGSNYNSVDSTGQQIFSVGKRLSSKTLLSYEQALGKAESIVKLTVSLGRQLSLVGRAGSDNAIDLFYTLNFGRDEKARGK